MTREYSKDFTVVLNYRPEERYDGNETDEELARGRSSTGEDESYDADVSFQMFYKSFCIDFLFNIFGLHVSTNVLYKSDFRDLLAVHAIVDEVALYFRDKKVEDISESMYRDIVDNLGRRTFEKVFGSGN